MRFIPSSKRTLAHRMQLLTKQEIKVNAILRDGPSSLRHGNWEKTKPVTLI